MPTLPNPRHERFAQELFKGTTQQEAYVLAGFNAHASNPSALAKDKRIVGRVAELSSDRAKIDAMAVEKAAETLGIDKAWVMSRLVENVERAMQAHPVGKVNEVGEPVGGEWAYDGSVANKALELLGKEFGMFVERREIRTGALADVPADTLSRLREQLITERNRRTDRREFEGNSGKPH